MKLIVDENLLSFKVLEQKIFDYVCELGCQITQQILEAYDTELAESRDKKHYRGKGKRKTCIKTVYGEVEYKRTVYRPKTEQGENAYIYLLDEAMQMDKIGLIFNARMNEIMETLSAAKTSKKDGKGNRYVELMRGHVPLIDAAATASRKVFRNAFIR